MKTLLGLGIIIITLVLVGLQWVNSGGLTQHEIRSAGNPTEAIEALMQDVQAKNWDRAYARLANTNDIEKPAFIRDLAGSYGSLRTYSSLDSFDVWPLRATADQAKLRVNMHWSTAIGPIDDVRDLNVEQKGGNWKVDWPVPKFNDVPPQVVPVNYLRWDIINRGPEDVWGEQNVDSPQVKIISMNPVERPDRLIILGEIENEDTVPAYVNVNATLLDQNQNPLSQEGSFDKISHTLLPKQVSPYRIDFPGVKLSQVKSVRMDSKAMLIPASADPVIEVAGQQIASDPLGKRILKGQLINQSGQVVNIAQALAAFYDANGKVIWVSDGYVDQALLPQTPVSFAVDLPDDVAKRVQNSHITVNHYSVNNNS
ncbi:MAG TPA: hypothetical protein VFA89_09520 [Terriglobales bacterium]|nr:hypothetical protein [Terriglobales bacterium]